MKAFVTGGTGFIGSHLVDRLIDDPSYDEVRCMVRSREKWIKDKEFTRVHGDLHNIPVLKSSLKDVDVIFHIAAIVKAPTQREFDYANVEATENLIRLAHKSGVKKMIILSSLAAAGPSFEYPLTEEDDMMPVSMYGESKKRMEEMIHNIAPKDMSITIVRPPAVYGPREEQIYTWFKMANKGISPIVGDGTKPRLSLIYVDDLIEGIMLAAGRIEKGVETYFFSGPEVVNWNQIRHISSGILNKKTIPLYIRPGLVKKIAGVIETSASLFGSYPVINREKAAEMILEWTCSHDKAITELGYDPKFSLEEGLRLTLNWYKKHHWL